MGRFFNSYFNSKGGRNWESLDVITSFAGIDIKKATYYPEDTAVLLEFEEKVAHPKVFAI